MTYSFTILILHLGNLSTQGNDERVYSFVTCIIINCILLIEQYF